MSTCVIFNPFAQGEKAKRLIRFLQTLPPECAVRGTTGPGAARTMAAKAVEDGFATVVAAGGDGTINEVVNGMAEAGIGRSRLGLLPLGTVNVFALELGVPRDVAKAWAIIQRCQEETIDVATLELETNGGRQKRLFVQLAGAGLDSVAVEEVSWQLKKKIGRLAYLVSAWKALRADLPPIKVTAGGKTLTGKTVLLGNGRYYGGKFPLFRGARMDDGLMDVCVFSEMNLATLLRFGRVYLFGGKFSQESESFLRGDVVEMSAPGRMPIELDGENAGYLPAVCRMQKQALRVIVGRKPVSLGA